MCSGKIYVMFCAIWYHLYNFKNMKTPMNECYQIEQLIRYVQVNFQLKYMFR